MENFKIYRNGKYDIKENFRIKAKEMLERMDEKFYALYK